MILPGSYIAAVEFGPTFGASMAVRASCCASRNGRVRTDPFPAVSRYHIFSEEMPKTCPFGAIQARGYQNRLKSGPKASRLLAPNRLRHRVPS